MSLRFRAAVEADIPAVAALLADDVLGAGREDVGAGVYLDAFRAMEREPHNTLIVGEENGEIVAVYQFTLISGVSLKGTRRAQIEGVRVSRARRGAGVGQALIRDAEARAKAGGAGLLQFTTNATRDRARDFYERMGFVPSHVGFKKSL